MSSSNGQGSVFSRRDFINVGIGTAAAVAFGSLPKAEAAPRPRLAFFPDELNGLTLPALPYDSSALAPTISGNTLGFHYGKHTSAYYTNLATAIAGSDLANQNLEAIIRRTAFDPGKVTIFNNASQAMNHSFYFAGLKGGGSGTPPAELVSALTTAFGGVSEFKAAMLSASTGQFGSGWSWLILNFYGKLEVISTPNAASPVSSHRGIPLLAIDVWEHAYYLDYQNLRAKYVTAVLDNLVNWDFVTNNLARAKSALRL